MHNALKRAAARRVVIAEHRSGFGGQCRLADAAVSPAGLRELQRKGVLPPNVVASLHRDACRARTSLRREIRARVTRLVTL